MNDILGREVDLVSRRGVEASFNYLRRNSILQSVQVIYQSWMVDDIFSIR